VCRYLAIKALDLFLEIFPDPVLTLGKSEDQIHGALANILWRYHHLTPFRIAALFASHIFLRTSIRVTWRWSRLIQRAVVQNASSSSPMITQERPVVSTLHA
jgi:hypothetical protein